MDSHSHSAALDRPVEAAATAVSASHPKQEGGGEPEAVPRSGQAQAAVVTLHPAQRAKRRAARPARAAGARRADRTARKPMPAPVHDVASASAAPTRTAPSATFGAGVKAADIPSTWKSRLLAHLDRHKGYPAGAAGAEGISQLTFTMDRAGRLLDFFIARSSGSAALDEAALAMIRRAEPLPAVPVEVSGGVLRLTVPVRFSLRG
ncbi:energy transducer TonB family protein [Chelatococcus reniformis]|uniref:TonB C-terminal domain-containing protein n=1 Tax=Chelatococcus reniformis TaxID=1494448 RepID=A0A916ULW0_9HYPH|nr:TonB family protein [Chelatococcus reniformis]GGC77635.1 hypothetical protein GCM10010994_39910 [Chelatococcus reniformis]